MKCKRVVKKPVKYIVERVYLAKHNKKSDEKLGLFIVTYQIYLFVYIMLIPLLW